MNLERTNLLPRHRIRSSHRNYFIRLGVITVSCGILVIVVHGIFLIPAYIYLVQRTGAESSQLLHLKDSLSSTGAQSVQNQLDTLQGEATYLQGLGTAPSVSTSIQSVLGVSRPGVRLSGFVYTAPRNGTAGTLEVSGIAATREQLRSFTQTLGALPFVTGTDLPISVYAQESKIPFTITLTGTFKP
jgi:Tfp pilus assembly protein PilN